jgi:hypothetical protein
LKVHAQFGATEAAAGSLQDESTTWAGDENIAAGHVELGLRMRRADPDPPAGVTPRNPAAVRWFARHPRPRTPGLSVQAKNSFSFHKLLRFIGVSLSPSLNYARWSF